MNPRPLLPLVVLATALVAAVHSPAALKPDLAAVVRAAASYTPGQSAEPLRHLEDLVRASVDHVAQRAEVEDALMVLLTDQASYEARLFACQQLALIGTGKSLPALEALLRDPATVGMACLALTTYPAPDADLILRRACGAVPHGPQTLPIVHALGDRRDPGAVRLLSGLARDSDGPRAEAAIVALGKIGSADAREALLDLRRADVPATRGPAFTEALLRLAEALAADRQTGTAASLYEPLLASTEPSAVRRGALTALLSLEGEAGAPRILNVLQARDPVLVPVAIAGVRSLRSPAVVRRMADELTSLAPAEQVLMLDALAALGTLAPRAAFLDRLNAADAQVRLAVVRGLGRRDEPSAVPALAEALARTTLAEERQAIEQVLGLMSGGAQTDLAVLSELRKAPRPAKASLMLVLVRRGVHAAWSTLLAESADPEPAVAAAAFGALGRMAAVDELPALLARLLDPLPGGVRDAAETAAAQALERVPEAPVRARRLLDALGKAEGVEARGSILALLPVAGEGQALAALQTALRTTDERVRDAAVRAVTEWHDAAAWDTLAGLYRQPPSEAYRVLALRALVRLAGDEADKAKAAGRYRALIEAAQNDSDRKLILSGLGRVPDPDALALAVTQLDQPGVRAEAVVAVRQIAAALRATHPDAAAAALGRLP